MAYLDDSTFYPHPDVVYTQLDDDEAVLLDITTSRYYSLNETGALIWQALQEKGGLRPVVEALERVYDVSREEAVARATAFLEELHRENLVVRATPDGR